nr:MAG: hypothetical protein [Sanya fiers-like virus 26]
MTESKWSNADLGTLALIGLVISLVGVIVISILVILQSKQGDAIIGVPNGKAYEAYWTEIQRERQTVRTPGPETTGFPRNTP